MIDIDLIGTITFSDILLIITAIILLLNIILGFVFLRKRKKLLDSEEQILRKQVNKVNIKLKGFLDEFKD